MCSEHLRTTVVKSRENVFPRAIIKNKLLPGAFTLLNTERKQSLPLRITFRTEKDVCKQVVIGIKCSSIFVIL